MAGKLSKDVRVYFGTYDFSTASVNVSVNLESLPLDSSVFPDAAQRVVAGNRQDSIEWAGLFNDGTSADAAGSALIGSAVNNVISVLVGTATGDRAYAGTGYLLAAKAISRIGELVRQEITIRPDQTWDVGKLQAPKSVFTDNVVSGTIDNGTATTAGANVYYHGFSVVSDVAGLNLEDSADGTTYAVVTGGSILFTAAGTGSSAKVSPTGTIKRYTRIRQGGYGTGTVTAAVVVVRL